MSKVAIWDCETNGLLGPKVNKDKSVSPPADRMHCVAAEVDGVWWLGDPHGTPDPEPRDVMLPSGMLLKGVLHTTVEVVLREVADADLRIAHNGQDFDDRVTVKLYPWWKPRGRCLDTLHVSKLLYPLIQYFGPNGHKLPPTMRSRHSVEAWGIRLGEKKDKGFDAGDWQTWTPEMSLYMLQDVVSLKRILVWLMSRKPAMEAVGIEHDFAAIIRRQEAWGFGFDQQAATTLTADLADRLEVLSRELVDHFGEWWAPGKMRRVAKTRRMKLTGYEEQGPVTLPRWNAKGQRMAKDYVGPPLCIYEEGAEYQEIERVEFNPASRDHARLMLDKLYGWKPTKWTKKGAPMVDDEVLRALPWPEAQKMADYFAADKIRGYVSKGSKAWLCTSVETDDGWRQHGRVNTIGTYTFRCSHFDPNMGQVPTRDPEFGHRCRALFCARPGFDLVGYDGSGLQLRLMAHYMAQWDGGEYANIVANEDPHAYMRDIVVAAAIEAGIKLTFLDPDAAHPGRPQGKTTNYALVFGGGTAKLGSIWLPYSRVSEQKALGVLIQQALAERLWAWVELKNAVAARVDDVGNLKGLDGRLAPIRKPHGALAVLLQMAEGVVMKRSLVILDRGLQAEGLRPGVEPSGLVNVAMADYEFCANVHDEAQADVRPHAVPTFQRLALQCVKQAGEEFNLKCALKSDVLVGRTWADTH